MPIRKKYRYDNGEHSVTGTRVGRFNLGINTTFIVYRIGDTLIDTGPSNQWREVKQVLQEDHQQTALRQLLITHHHEDHSGNAQRISQLTGVLPHAPVQGQEKLARGYRTPLLQRIIWGSPRPVATQALHNDLTLSDGSPVIPVHTPGHAKDLTCLFLPQQKYLFSGDMYISKSLKYLRIDEHLGELIHSLDKLLALDFEILFCPHRGIVEDGKAALQEKRDNLYQLCKQAQQLQQQGLKEEEIVIRILGPEDWLAKISGYNISKTNLIRQALAYSL
ncbi:MBL fold metallo-hydrolase [Thalassolituus hydrocarboniclasticus]|uniref:MBL fold metallo-hydrolase n=1 Tax=Thalassolituus hydrocarboniclasticus TaxID=2742796 RepID=A0ABY6AD90_9GAMM|nr:MBL fold metallo-hydrolase [Thalassolituus hydrocarboniclasticus]UXD88783.1 MBL fold metallo-hydrolase [Thalassolituus hydrocarboniclasticus]